MLRIDTVQTLEGLQVYGDDASATTHYVLPEQPRFRLDEAGEPVFRYLKYKQPKPREDGKNGGGFVVFDVEFTVDDDKQQAILETLKQQASKARLRPESVRLGTIQWAKGTAKLNIADVSNQFVEQVFNPASPSLFGKNITPFTVELTQEGATLFEQALQGQGGFVQVVYEMSAWVKLPPIVGKAWFHAEQFYDYVQTAKDDDDIYEDDEFQNIIHEDLVSSQAMGVELDSGMGVDEKLKAQIRDSLYRTLEDTVAQKILEKVPSYTGDRSVLDDYETIRREFHSSRIDDFTYTVSEKSAALWPFNPQGTLPNITTLKNKSGTPVKWSDHSALVDLDDPFFRTINLSVRVNAEFEELGLNSVDVHVEYGQTKKEILDHHFTSPDDVGTLSCFKDGDLVDYTYSYRVNYEGESRAFEVAPATDRREQLTIGVDDTGLLLVDVIIGNLDLAVFSSALVTMRYTPVAGDPIEEQFLFDKDNSNHRLSAAIFEARTRPVEYDVEYRLVGGKTITTTGHTTNSRQVTVDSPFRDIRKFAFRAVGNLTTEIEAIDVDAADVDDVNDYTVRDNRALREGNDFWDWSIPVFDATVGRLTYSATIRRKDGTVEIVPETEATQATIAFGEKVAKLLTVTVVPDLVDFTQVSLVKVELRYRPDGTTDDQVDDVLVRQGAAIEPWTIEVDDPSKTSYFWSATYFMTDQTQREITESSSSDPTIVLPALPPAQV